MSSSLFSPKNTQTVVATTTSATTAFSSIGTTMRLAVTGTLPVFIAFGDAAVVATLSSMPLFPGGPELFDTPARMTHFAVITESSSSRISITMGEGDE